jgi:large subunit ribosomal protein L15
MKQRRKRVGRGPGSGLGKTCGRGEKGAGARSGYKRRFGYEGGQFRTFMKIPQRGFNQARFRQAYDVINLYQIDSMFEEGEVVNLVTLAERGFISNKTYGIKILGHGELTKNLTIEAHAFSNSAREKLSAANISIVHLTDDLLASEQFLARNDDDGEQ